jgi:hypothetical protein
VGLRRDFLHDPAQVAGVEPRWQALFGDPHILAATVPVNGIKPT